MKLATFYNFQRNIEQLWIVNHQRNICLQVILISKMIPKLIQKITAVLNFQITKSGLLFDLGYKNFGDPASFRNTNVKITDPSNNICNVKNSEINTINGSDDHKLKFRTNEKMKAFLSRRCPNLDLSSLSTIKSSSSRTNAIK